MLSSPETGNVNLGDRTAACAMATNLIVGILAVLFVAWLVVQLQSSRIVRRARRNGNSVCKMIGGARLAVFNATIPFATLIATSDWISISIIGREYRFHRRDIRSLSKYSSLYSTGLRIEHKQRDYPELVVFWTLNFDRLCGALGALGYVID